MEMIEKLNLVQLCQGFRSGVFFQSLQHSGQHAVCPKSLPAQWQVVALPFLIWNLIKC